MASKESQALPAGLQAEEIRALIAAALAARQAAYAPYSGMAVGAALLSASGAVYRGCNIENAAFSPTLCAERTAMAKAVSDHVREFRALAVAGGPAACGPPLPTWFYPCGVCRQWLAEFCSADFVVIVALSTEEYQVLRLADLLPHGFSRGSMAR